MIALPHYLALSSLLFGLGLFGVLTRRNAVAILMGIELMLNAANVNFVAFTKFIDPTFVRGHVAALIVITLAACEVVVGLALVINAYRHLETVHVDEVDVMRG